MSDAITTEARQQSISAALTAAAEAASQGKNAVESLRWKGTEIQLPVASVDVDLVLLNPHSHRISAQLQSLSQTKQDVVASDPFGPEAQQVITDLLKATEGYEAIKSAINNDGQRDAGVLTTAGVLINANTRVVALRELHRNYVKVVVLPSDASSKEITDLELSLQMEQEVKQPYSFTSRLLFIEDLISSGNYTTQQVGRALHPELTKSKADTKKAVDLVEVELRLLGLIREVLTASGGSLNFLYFDDKRQALLETDQDYQKTKTAKPEEAVRVRDAQLAGLLAGIDYRKLREIDTTLLDSYVAPALREDSNLGPHADALLSSVDSAGTDLEGLDLIDDADPEPSAGPSLSTLYSALAQAGPEDLVPMPAESGNQAELPRAAVAAGLYSAFLVAIENKQRDQRHVDDLTAPMVHLKEAARSLDKAASAFSDVHTRTAFNRTKFDLAVEEYERAADAFAATTASPSPPTATAPVGDDAKVSGA